MDEPHANSYYTEDDKAILVLDSDPDISELVRVGKIKKIKKNCVMCLGRDKNSILILDSNPDIKKNFKMKRKNFGLINEIDLNNPVSWKYKIFITLDMDWAIPEVMKLSIDLLEDFEAKATWFVTHPTKMLNRLRENPKFELGIHPNFNPLILEGNHEKGNSAYTIITELMDLIPEAVSVRSHSLTFNQRLLGLYSSFGLKYDCDTFIPWDNEITLKPFLHWNKIIGVPHFWEDDMNFYYKWDIDEVFKKVVNYQGITVVAFHPIHIFLNSESLDRYETAKEYNSNPKKLRKFRNNSTKGTFDFFIELLKFFSEKSIKKESLGN